jgi:hypothetical protein
VSIIALNADSITDAVPFAENVPTELATNEILANPWIVSEAGSRTCSVNAADPCPDDASYGTIIADADKDPTPRIDKELV